MSAEARAARLTALTGGATATPAAATDRRVTPRGAISRDRIVDATLELVAEGGYAALSISAICKRANVSAASLYHHFGDKAGLLSAVIEESIRDSARRLADAVSDAERPLDQLNAFFDAARDVGRDKRTDTITVLLALAEARTDAPEIAGAIADARARAWAFVAAELADRLGVEDGMLLAHLQFAFASYIAHVVQSSKTKDDAKAIFASFRRIMLITVAALRPDFAARDRAFAEAVAAASRQAPDSHHVRPRGEAP